MQPLSRARAFTSYSRRTAGIASATNRPNFLRWRQLNPGTNAAGAGETVENFYGESRQVCQGHQPVFPTQGLAQASPPPRFDPPAALKVTLREGDRWVKADDFTGKLAAIGRVRSKFGATVATFDADGDGRADLFLAAAVKGPKGVRDALLLNKGDGAFEDASKAWGLPDDRASSARPVLTLTPTGASTSSSPGSTAITSSATKAARRSLT